jgi:hypothetical protein
VSTPSAGSDEPGRSEDRDDLPGSGPHPGTHEDPESGGDGDLLRCATLGASCPVCGEPVRLREGFLYLPDDDVG